MRSIPLMSVLHSAPIPLSGSTCTVTGAFISRIHMSTCHLSHVWTATTARLMQQPSEGEGRSPPPHTGRAITGPQKALVGLKQTRTETMCFQFNQGILAKTLQSHLPLLFFFFF